MKLSGLPMLWQVRLQFETPQVPLDEPTDF